MRLIYIHLIAAAACLKQTHEGHPLAAIMNSLLTGPQNERQDICPIDGKLHEVALGTPKMQNKLPLLH